MVLLDVNGIIKVSDPYTTGTVSNYDVLLNKRSTLHLYLSPEQTDALRQEISHPPCKQSSKCDIWTLGMIMLEAGLLQYQDECYRDECARINW